MEVTLKGEVERWKRRAAEEEERAVAAEDERTRMDARIGELEHEIEVVEAKMGDEARAAKTRLETE